MKRQMAVTLAAFLLVGFSGCGQKQENTTVPSVVESSTPDSAVPQDDSLYLLSGEAPNGFYHMGTDSENYLIQRMCYIDYTEGIDKVLCNKPGCTHAEEGCTALPPDGRGVYFLYALQNGSIAYLESKQTDDGEPDCLCLADADGDHRRKLAAAASAAEDWELLCADGAHIYILQTTYSEEAQKHQILSASLEDGNLETLWEMPGDMPQLIGVQGRNLVLHQVLREQDEIPPLEITADMSEEEVQRLSDEYDSMLSTLESSHRVYLFSMDTGEEQEVASWTSSQGSLGRTVLWDENRLYWCNDVATDSLHWGSPDGQAGEVPVDWPQDIAHPQKTDDMVIYLEQPLQDQILLTVFGPWGTDLIKRYALNPEDGSLREIPLQYISNAYEQPIRIMGQGKVGLLVEFEEQLETTESVDEDGSPVQNWKFSYRRGLISPEDFFAGVPNYREIVQETE